MSALDSILHHVVKWLRSYSSSSFQLIDALWVPQDIEYDAGDVLEILPGQDSAAVDAFIRRCDLDPDSFISVSLLRIFNVRLYEIFLTYHKIS